MREDTRYRTEMARHQYLPELDAFAELLLARKCRSYLEIGSKFGCSLWRIGTRLPLGSLLVAVDLPSSNSDNASSLNACGHALKEAGYEVAIFYGDSTADLIVRSVRNLAPFDAVFIDANHTLAYVTKDWENYAPLGRCVAFHDIAFVPKPEKRGLPIEVPLVWERLKASHHTMEIRLDPTGRHNGIGVVFMEDRK